jgi:hypothetical protein
MRLHVLLVHHGCHTDSSVIAAAVPPGWCLALLIDEFQDVIP